MNPSSPPSRTAADETRLKVLYHYCRLQMPEIAIPEMQFQDAIQRTYTVYAPKHKGEIPLSWESYLAGLNVLDWLVCVGCLNGLERAWEHLFAARTGRSDALLVDALRKRACWLYPRNEERQETAVAEFWGYLLVPDNDTREPILTRYDGRRPLTPWLITIFQNLQITKLRRDRKIATILDSDDPIPLPGRPTSEEHWRDIFCQSGREWLRQIKDQDRLLLGLRWRYGLTQRKIAPIFDVNEGTITRRIDHLRNEAHEFIYKRMVEQDWPGGDLLDMFLSEMGSILLDDPNFSADQLSRLLSTIGKELPEATPTKSE
ncbi:MAG: sigma-70 family RNA polymerase sigma factor [Bacteroidales bacterium]|nr:sigma-70 family RNA polymerase sigma factor [Bacteroidales bacterium]